MKKLFYYLLLVALLCSSCKKNSENEPTLSAADQAAYDSILSIQDQASDKFDLWVQSMDTLSALTQVQQLFAANHAVASATLSSQGVAVQYANGMGGGIFLNPQDEPVGSFLNAGNPAGFPWPPKAPKSAVNLKKVIFLNPSYWQRSNYADWIIQHYTYYLPWVGFALQDVFKNTDATLDRFTGLAGHGVVHVYSHGWAWPSETNLTEVYMMTGEVANLSSTVKYLADIKKMNIIVSKTENATGWHNIYWIKKDFIIAHNNFSKDTVLFYGGFCYSFLGTWDQLYTKFASGSYFGFTWYVRTNMNASWNVSLMDSLADTASRPAYTPESWITGPNPAKSYYDNEAMKTVSVQYVGDAYLTFWQPPLAGFSWTCSSMHSSTEICKGSTVSVQDKSKDNGFPITSWQWYFSNGTPESFVGKQPPVIVFNTVGWGGITLIVSNSLGYTSKEVDFNVVTCK
jgi:hypothetical protein